MAMVFKRRWDFDQASKLITTNDLRDDDEIKDLIAEAAAGGEVTVSFKNIEEDLTVPTTDTVGQWEIVDDGTGTNGWAERLVMWFKPQSAARRRTFYLNEYGEARVSPAKNNTVPLRLFSRETLADPVHDAGVALLEIMDNRTDRNVTFQVLQDGRIVSPSVAAKVVTVPTGTTGFATQPDGTLWVEYTP